jgi:hypothetical protein
MKVKNNSIIDTVIDYANVKFGMEISQADISAQLKSLSYGDTLTLVDAIAKENDEKFSDIIDLSAVSEAYGTANTSAPSRATTRMANQDNDNRNRRADNIDMKMQRPPLAPRNTAGVGGGTGGTSNASKQITDPDDQKAMANAQGVADTQATQDGMRADIERLKQLAMGNRR